jgi:hypothetical protein
MIKKWQNGGAGLLVACSDESGNETLVVLKARCGTVEVGSFGRCSLACELILRF